MISVAIILIFGSWYLLKYKEAVSVSNKPNYTNSTTTSSDVASSTVPILGESRLIGIPSSTSEIVISAPVSGQKVAAPLTVSGKARGGWYFEASAPVTVMDSSGKILGQGFVMAEGEWMTSEFVPFKGTINFNPGRATSGAVVFNNDNPSGEVSRARYVAIPVFFK